jgi:hypothetical protein
MSGGSWDYVYMKVEEVSISLRSSKDPRRRALGLKVHLIAEAMHAIEWVDSGDESPGDEYEAIDKVISKTDLLEEAIFNAEACLKEIQDALAAARKERKK